MFLESQRILLEEIQTIQNAISERIQKNPSISQHFRKDIDNSNLINKKRSFKQTILTELEISRFIKQYKRQKIELSKVWINDGTNDDSFTLGKFDQLYNDIKNSNKDEVIVKPLRSIYSKPKNSKISEFAHDLKLSTIFSTEEYFGKYLDLINFHERWLNLNSSKLNYVEYLDSFTNFTIQEITNPTSDDYRKYLNDLEEYILSFIAKSHPLLDLDELLDSIKQESLNHVDPLYCSVCDRSFAKQTVYDGHLSGKKHIKNSQRPKLVTYQDLEYRISQLSKVIKKEIQETKLNIQRRQTLSERERLIEIDKLSQQEISEDEDDTDDEQNDRKEGDDNENPDFINGVYNPLNLPLGPDGQPIPHWLYKLHGMGIEYSCEICGNHVYKGRKQFELHFQDSRHLYGLRCLGIKPSAVFKDIVKIEQAVELWNKLQKHERQLETLKNDSVEVEDEEGNVMSEKVYNDLKKQGLV